MLNKIKSRIEIVLIMMINKFNNYNIHKIKLQKFDFTVFKQRMTKKRKY